VDNASSALGASFAWSIRIDRRSSSTTFRSGRSTSMLLWDCWKARTPCCLRAFVQPRQGDQPSSIAELSHVLVTSVGYLR
jgi:hypothetical protein